MLPLRNRIRSATRWPNDPRAVKVLAEMDLEFVLALEKCGICRSQNPVLFEIAEVACERYMEACRGPGK